MLAAEEMLVQEVQVASWKEGPGPVQQDPRYEAVKLA